MLSLCTSSIQAMTSHLHRRPLTAATDLSLSHIRYRHDCFRTKRNRILIGKRISSLPPLTHLIIVCSIPALLFYFTIEPLFEAFTGSNVSDEPAIENHSNNEAHKLNVFRYKGVGDLMKMIDDYWSKNEIFCPVAEKRLISRTPDLPVSVKIQFNCQELFDFPSWGTASFINLFYGIRLTALVDGNIHLYLQCDDAYDKQLELIHPWLMGYFPPPDKVENAPTNDLKSWPLSCVHNFYSLAYAYDLIQYDLRRMAVALVGTTDHMSDDVKQHFWSQPPNNALRSVYTLPTPQKGDTPLFASTNITLDDAVIHFRCGDLMNSTHPLYSLVSFYDYTRFISKEATSIGILTQSFNCDDNRILDASPDLCNRCRIVVTSLVDFIQEKYPNAIVSIRNSKQETTALTYARMIVANQTIVGISGFSAFAAMATFGTSYIPIPHRYSANFVVNYEPSSLLPINVVRYSDAKVIMVADLKTLWESVNGTERVLEWFWDMSHVPNDVVSTWINYKDDDIFISYDWPTDALCLLATATICFVFRRRVRRYHIILILLVLALLLYIDEFIDL